ncbi:Gfo/Idh/MocA family oxidoreductase [Klebsiella pneumoniae]|nr:Gfo/Idh/MocA family oxidoreductase [Klebsiella pneumoniae]
MRAGNSANWWRRKAISITHRPLAETNPGGPQQNGEFYGLGVHTPDQIISLFGRPDHVSYDLRSLRNKANPDDTFEAQLFYGDKEGHR